jgi:hypothetical protein
MAETKTVQKNWRFSPEIITELEALCKKERRSEQNMVEVLIDNAFLDIRLDDVLNQKGQADESIEKSRTADVNS